MSPRFAFVIAAIGAALAGLSPEPAAAHGRGHRYGPPPFVVVPDAGRPYPYWYYGRPHRPGPPGHYVVPAPRYDYPHRRRHRGPDFSFSFRF